VQRLGVAGLQRKRCPTVLLSSRPVTQPQPRGATVGVQLCRFAEQRATLSWTEGGERRALRNWVGRACSGLCTSSWQLPQRLRVQLLRTARVARAVRGVAFVAQCFPGGKGWNRGLLSQRLCADAAHRRRRDGRSSWSGRVCRRGGSRADARFLAPAELSLQRLLACLPADTAASAHEQQARAAMRPHLHGVVGSSHGGDPSRPQKREKRGTPL